TPDSPLAEVPVIETGDIVPPVLPPAEPNWKLRDVFFLAILFWLINNTFLILLVGRASKLPSFRGNTPGEVLSSPLYSLLLLFFCYLLFFALLKVVVTVGTG